MSDPTRAEKRCGRCSGVVYVDATHCKHCQAPREEMLKPPPPPMAARCPSCRGRIHPTARRCKHCGVDLP